MCSFLSAMISPSRMQPLGNTSDMELGIEPSHTVMNPNEFPDLIRGFMGGRRGKWFVSH